MVSASSGQKHSTYKEQQHTLLEVNPHDTTNLAKSFDLLPTYQTPILLLQLPQYNVPTNSTII